MSSPFRVFRVVRGLMNLLHVGLKKVNAKMQGFADEGLF